MSEIERNLDTLAECINEEHRRCEAAVTSALEHALAAGDLLLEARGTCPHGAWQAWLEGNFAGSVRTAQAYMRVAARRDEVEAAKTQSSAPLSLDRALRALSAAKDDPERSFEAPGKRSWAGGQGDSLRRFEEYMEFTEALVQIRDSGAWKESGHESFEAYLQARWNIEPALLYAAEEAMNDPVERVRAMLLCELYELVPGIKLTATGIERIPEDLDYERWRKGLGILNAMAATFPGLRLR